MSLLDNIINYLSKVTENEEIYSDYIITADFQSEQKHVKLDPIRVVSP